MPINLGLFYPKKLGNPVHYIFVFIFFVLFSFKRFLWTRSYRLQIIFKTDLLIHRLDLKRFFLWVRVDMRVMCDSGGYNLHILSPIDKAVFIHWISFSIHIICVEFILWASIIKFLWIGKCLFNLAILFCKVSYFK